MRILLLQVENLWWRSSPKWYMRKSEFELRSVSKGYHLVHWTWYLTASCRNCFLCWGYKDKSEVVLAVSQKGDVYFSTWPKLMNDAAAWAGNSWKKAKKKWKWRGMTYRIFILTPLVLSLFVALFCCHIGLHAFFPFGSVLPFVNGPNVSNLPSE